MEFIGGLEGQLGDIFCFDFIVINFIDVEDMWFSIVWEFENLEYLIGVGFQNVNFFSGVVVLNVFGFGNGQILFDNWNFFLFVILVDGIFIFIFCF